MEILPGGEILKKIISFDHFVQHVLLLCFIFVCLFVFLYILMFWKLELKRQEQISKGEGRANTSLSPTLSHPTSECNFMKNGFTLNRTEQKDTLISFIGSEFIELHCG